MKTSTFWILGLVFVILGYHYIYPSTPRTITTNGECLTTAPRDKTAITLRVTTLDKNALTSMRNATSKITEINAYLANLDVENQTIEFDSYEQTEWNNEKQRDVSVGTKTTIAIEISANNIDIIEQILNKFAGQPDIYVGNLKMFTSRETMQPIMNECLENAVQDARKHAISLAAGDKSRVGKMLAVSYGNTYSQSNQYNYQIVPKMTTDAFTGAGTFGTLTSKDTNISVKVSATFEIK